ncbi:MAG: T9SS type A sorting domain-containing protein [Candidatus Cloacimonetes bacterium]|nr:T9SS type A sorting domain-containing protein [Candidatus Cloacimonadota bacterium]
MRKRCFNVLLVLSVLSGLFCQNPLKQLMAIDSPISVPVSQSSYFFYLRKQQIIGNGDLNGDGYNDIVICGQPNSGDTSQYKLFIYLGAPQMDSLPDYILESPEPEDPYLTYGAIIDYSNDINGDGIDDLVVSSPKSGWWWCTGKVYIYFGGNTINNQPDVVLDGADYYPEYDQLEFGQAICTAGDFNGDGYQDLVVSSLAWGWGQVNVFFGGPQFDSTSDWVKSGNMNDFLGIHIAAGDFNGDGYDDLLIVSAIDGGVLYNLKIYYGAADFDTIEDWEANFTNEHLKYTFLDQDLNRDSFNDLAIYSGAAGLRFCWGGQEPSCVFESVPSLEFNFTKLYFSAFSDELCLTTDAYQLNHLYCYRYSPVSGLVTEYYVNEAYNPNGVFHISYYLGDINGDKNAEILLGSLAQNQAQLKAFTTQCTAVEDLVIPHVPETELFCYPNPFKNMVNVDFKTSRNNDLALEVYNIKGQLVADLDLGHKGSGQHSALWDGRDHAGRKLPSGVYLLRLKLGEECISSKKVTLCY